MCWELTAPETQWGLLAVYPFCTALTAVAFFPLGSTFWGRLYIFGLIFFAAAPLMALRLEWAPLELGFLITVLMCNIARHLRGIERERLA